MRSSVLILTDVQAPLTSNEELFPGALAKRSTLSWRVVSIMAGLRTLYLLGFVPKGASISKMRLPPEEGSPRIKSAFPGKVGPEDCCWERRPPRYLPHMVACLIVLATMVRKPFRLCVPRLDRERSIEDASVPWGFSLG